MDLKQRVHQVRLLLVLALCLTGLMALGLRLYQLQIRDSSGRSKSRQGQGKLPLTPERGGIYDRNQVPLALNCDRPCLRLEDRKWEPSGSSVTRLAAALGMDRDKLQSRIDLICRKMRQPGSNLRSDIVCYNLDQAQREAVEALGLPGLFFTDGIGRVYPAGSLAASTLGFVGLNVGGGGGIERYAETYLHGSVGTLPTLLDGHGTHLLWTDVTKLRSTRGADVVLALDTHIQCLAEKELDRINDQYRPLWASIVVMEPFRGEVLAVANRPTFDPNHLEFSTSAGMKNYAICEPFEPGSTLKAFTIAAALEGQFVTPSTTIDCENGYYYVFGSPLRDVHPYGLLTVEGVLAHSSNIGAVKIAQQTGQECLHDMLRSLRFGCGTGVTFPKEAPGLFRPLSRWTPYSTRAIPFGQEMQTTVLGLTTAYCAIASGGRMQVPKLILGYRNPRTGALQPHEYPEPVQVFSKATAETLTQMLTAVTAYGSGTKARVKGFQVAGKTGTAQIFDRALKEYSDEDYLASFVGFLPAEQPKVVIAVVVCQPRGGKYGGEVAGPAFARLAGGLMQYLEVFPTEPDSRWKIAQNLFEEAPLELAGPVHLRDSGTPAAGMLMLGMTMREAYRSLCQQGIPLAFQGSGIALVQEPRVFARSGGLPGVLTVEFFPPKRLSWDGGPARTGT